MNTTTRLIAGGMLALAASAGAAASTASAKDANGAYEIIAVLGPLGDPFFSAMEKGTKDAAQAASVTFEYTAPNGFDNLSQDLARLIEVGISRKPDAMVIGNFIPDAQNEGIRAAVAAGIEVVVINTGADNWRELGAITFVGEELTTVGRKAAELHLAAGAAHGLCINHVPGNPGTEARCQGFKEDMEAGGKKVTVLNLPYSSQGSPQQIVQAVTGALTADSSIDAIYTLGSGLAENALQAVADGGFSETVKVGTSDVSRRTLEAVKDATLLFDLDQQPYMQGYYGVLVAAQYLKHGVKPIGSITTGPLIITKDNVEKVLDPDVVPYRGAM